MPNLKDEDVSSYTGEALDPKRLSWFENKFVHPRNKPLPKSASNPALYGTADAADASAGDPASTESLCQSPSAV